jgi:hypothetical protein
MAFSLWAAMKRRFVPDFGTIPTFARDYLRVLFAEYESMPKRPGYAESNTLAGFRQEQDDRLWSWADLVTVENAIVNAADDAQMSSLTVEFRERYRDIVGDTRYAYYSQSSPPDPKAASADELRADVRSLADRIHYRLATVAAREKMRNRLALLVGLVMIVSAVVVLLPAFTWDSPNGMPHLNKNCLEVTYCVPLNALQLVMLAGLFGGFISVQQRLQATTDVDPFFKRLELSAGWGSIVLLAPLMGAVFAIVLLEIFVSGALSGQLLPQFQSNPPAGLTSWEKFSYGSTPKDGIDWAKLSVWAFIAGFAERFVPDVLTRISSMKNVLADIKP